MPEVVEHGVTGFTVDSIDEAVAAVEKVGSLSRKAVRHRFEERFSVERTARDYVRVYESLAAEPIVRPGGARPGAEPWILRPTTLARSDRRPPRPGAARGSEEISP